MALAQSPLANFTATPLSGCSPLVVDFQDLSSGNPTAWAWDFGNGSRSSVQNPSTTYFTSGRYTVTLTVTNESGKHTLTRTEYIEVYPKPTVDFSVDKRNGCFPVTTRFRDGSTGGAGSTPVSWLWDFGNGTQSTEQHPVNTYRGADNYTVVLKVTNDKGCSQVATKVNYVQVTEGVRAGFTFTQPKSCQLPLTTTFANTSTGVGTLTYSWSFGDGSTATTRNTNHTYTQPGAYPVQLVVASSLGCADTLRRDSLIHIPNVQVAAEIPDAVCAQTPVQFRSTSQPVPDSAYWSFGDGTLSGDSAPIKTFDRAGTYTIKSYNRYSFCIDSLVKNITVHALPVPAFTSTNNRSCRAPLTVSFRDVTPGATGWQWDFGDGQTSTEQHPRHTYNGEGVFPVRLIVTNANGCQDTVLVEDAVQILKPQVTLEATHVEGCVPFVFRPKPVITTLDNVTSYSWEFSNGFTSSQREPSLVFRNQGSYSGRLTITTSTGCTETRQFDNLLLIGTKPVTAFSGTPLEQCALTPVTFTSESAPADRWEWSFGDGGTASGATVTHMFSDTGKLFVQLIAYNSGCPDTLRKEEYVHIKPPIANFGFRYDCVNRLLFRFSDSSIGATSWKWTFGDGGESTDRSPSHAFARTGSYPVTLTVTNGNCSHSSTQTVLILPDQVQLVSNKDTACRGSSVTYSARNTEESMITSYSWTIGNGITQTTTSPSTRYVHTQSGRYDVTLVTTDIYGCQKRYTEANVVQINGADARFRVDSRNICTGLPVVFTDLSTTDGTHPITRWHWAFGDETETTYTTATPSITHTYQDSSRYSVRLTVTDAAGCTDDFYVPNAITTTRPLSGFTYRARTCPGSDNQFTNTSTQYRSLAWDFGDGRTSTAVNPVHAYADTGTFSVRLVATDARGCTDTTRFPVQVYRPQVSFSVKDTVSFCNPFEVNFRYTSTYLESFVWDLDGGTSRERNPTRFYTLPGTYRVKLTGRGFGGCVDSAKTTITLYDTSIALSYRASLQCSPFPVSFAGSSAVKTLPYTWDFGDGNISNSRLPDTTHVYNTYGDFVPKLLIFDPAGCPPLVAQGRDTIHVRGALVKFKPDRDLMCDSGLVQFTDSTTFNDDVRTYTWDFGDGQTAQAKDTSHFYDEPGEYRVSLNVRTDIGCSARMDTLIRVVRSPTVLIGGDSIICVNNSIDHLGRLRIPDTSQVQWTWQLPNGQSYGEQDLPVQRYDRPGTFPLTLTAVNSSGCRGTALKNIRVNPLPRADMPGTMTIQPGFPAVIPAQFDSNVVRYTWTPPAGLSCTDCPQPEASPKFNTKYVVDFEDLNGCRNSAEVQILVICKNGNVFVPNTFSPNGDGSNDLFYVRGKGLARVKALRVFNRWGEIVYEKREFPANDPAYGWNGRFRNGPPHPDVYVYQVEVYCENGEVIRFDGNVALIQ